MSKKTTSNKLVKVKPVRKYSDIEILKLVVACGGRCTLCNQNIMFDEFSHKDIRTFQKAHIKAFSDNGPRADSGLSIEERNSSENLIVLCPTCHVKIDSEIGRKTYTVDFLKRWKVEKEKRIQKRLESFDLIKCIPIKYFSAIGDQENTINDSALFSYCFDNGFSTEDVVNLSDDILQEDVIISEGQLKEKFRQRIQRLYDNGQESPLVVFARAPQPLLVLLGYLLNDKHDVRLFTSHRNNKWVYDEPTEEQNYFEILKPDKYSNFNNIALCIDSTAIIEDDRVYTALGSDIDIWRLRAKNIGIDNINSQKELELFHKKCVEILDQIGAIYGREKSINMFSAMGNSLAITFGRSIFHKAHNPINIFDKKNDGVERRDVLSLSINED